MGYTTQTLELIRNFKNLKWKNIEIVELGSQDISVSIDVINNFIKSFGNNSSTSNSTAYGSSLNS